MSWIHFLNLNRTCMTDNRILVAQQSARKILDDRGIENPTSVKLEHLAFDLRVAVKAGHLKGMTATLLAKPNRGIITINTNITEYGRRRFAIAHELGHFVLHRGKRPAYFCTEEKFMDWYTSDPQELEANAFAAELLLPRDIFKTYLGGQPPTKELLSKCAESFQTSLTATCIRYVDVGPYPCILVVSTDGILKWFRKSHDFPNYNLIKVRGPVSEYSYAGDYFDTDEEEKVFSKVRADAWFDDERLGRDSMINEVAFYLTSYNTVLSFVWLE